MIKMFCDCCGKEIAHKHDVVEVETTGSPRKSLLCQPCFGPVQKILTGNGRVG